MSRTLPLALAAAAALAGAAPGQDKKDLDTTLDSHKALAAAVAAAEKVVLLEGLPHQLFEKELLDKELKDKKTQAHHGHPFYAEPLALKADDAKALAALFGAAKSFEPWRGEKRCGGFHPDYAVAWHTKDGVYHAQVCFGCSEVKVFGPKLETRWDLKSGAKAELEKVLKPYRKNRPAQG